MPAEARVAGVDDVHAAAELLHRFNVEYDDVTPGPHALAERLRLLLDRGDTAVLLAGDGPDGVCVLRFRPSIWTAGDECYLAELYVVPERRGAGLGRALVTLALDTARDCGADFIDLGTSEDDVAARALYESMGFTNRERPDGPIMYVYEREL